MQVCKIGVLLLIICVLISCDTSSDVVIYSAPETEIHSPDFNVQVNGKDVFVYLARVSAIPHNQTWPGYQRPKYQTEMASFAYFDMSGPVSVAVTSTKAIRTVDIRPSSYGIQPVVNGNTISFDLDRPRKIAIEVNGTHHALHLFANDIEEFKPDPDDPNVRYYGPGVHHEGIIKLKDNETVYIAGGAVVHGVIEVTDVSNIKILGRGILDASTIGRFDAYEMIFMFGCSDVQIDGIILRDPHRWTVAPFKCNDVHISDIKLIGLWRYNSDGIDITNCQEVTVKNCFIRAYDDNIAIKGHQLREWGREYDTGEQNVRNIEISDCVLWGDWGRALEIGTTTKADSIGNIVFKDCDIIHYVHFALGITNRDRGIVHNVRYDNIRIEEPTIHNVRLADKDYDPAEMYIGKIIQLDIRKNPRLEELGKIRNIQYRNIYYRGQIIPKSVIYGYGEEHQVRNVTIENFYINGRKIESPDEGNIKVNDYVENIIIK